MNLNVFHKWCHGLRGRGSRILWWNYLSSLINKKRDDGRGGSKLRDVIYERPLSQSCLTWWWPGGRPLTFGSDRVWRRSQTWGWRRRRRRRRWWWWRWRRRRWGNSLLSLNRCLNLRDNVNLLCPDYFWFLGDKNWGIVFFFFLFGARENHQIAGLVMVVRFLILWL